MYVSIGSILIACKVFIGFQHSYSWWLKDVRNRERRGGYSRRFPVVPTISWSLFGFYLAFFVLTFLDVGTARNGIPAALFGLGWLSVGIVSLFYLFKFVSLGYRIIPHRIRATRMPLASSRISSGARAGIPDEDETLSKFDFAGKFSVVCCFLALTVQTICFVILAPIMPGDTRILRIGFGFQAWFMFQHQFCLTHHFRRVKAA